MSKRKRPKTLDEPSEATLKEVEADTKARARKRGYSKEREDAYVYGTKRKLGWKPSRERKKKSK